MSIKVSVIMPSLNVAEYIEECMESVLRQTLRDIEIICVDAGSADGTREMLEDYAHKDSRIRVIDSDVRSYGRQVNTGIDAAGGKYIGIVETDDFIEDGMYEKLFLAAEENALDYAMADYKAFYGDAATGRVFHCIGSKPGMYGRILSMHGHAVNYVAGDVNIWRGIYSRSFLDINRIRLNETPGAAFQDICFMHRVRMQARRGMHINIYGYCHRRDRDGSSINSAKGLQYAAHEYRHLLEYDDIPAEYLGRVYSEMACSALVESGKMLSKCGYAWCGEDSICYEWFRDTLSRAAGKKLLAESMLPEGHWKQLDILLRSRDEYAARLRAPLDNRESMRKAVENAPVAIICGAGKRGMEAAKFMKTEGLTRNGARLMYADNDSRLWGIWRDGIEIRPVEQCATEHKEAGFVIASKFHGGELREQLLSYGVAEGNICEYNPYISWDCVK